MTFRTKILAIVSGAIISSLLVLQISAGFITTHHMELFFKENEATFASPLTAEKITYDLQAAYSNNGWDGVSHALEYNVYLLDVLVLDLMGGQLRASSRPELLNGRVQEKGNNFSYQSADGNLRLLVNPDHYPNLISPNGAVGLIVTLPKKSMAPGSGLASSINQTILVVGGIIAVLTLIGLHLLVQQTMRPLADIENSLAHIGEGDGKMTVPVKGNDEIARIAKSLNQLLAQQRAAQKTRQALLSDIAHELRTPLTGLRCQVETLVDGLKPANGPALKSLLDSLLQLQGLYTDLEDLALTDANEVRLSPENAKLGPIVNAARDTVLVISAQRSIVIDKSIGRCDVHADAQRLGQVITNLLKNAVSATSDDGSIFVSAVADTDGNILISVKDDGPGVDTVHAAHIFDRFYRADTAKNPNDKRHGLGLTIAKSLAEMMGGGIRLVNPGNSGAIFEVRMPRAVKLD